jgi:hypothetical protein
MTEQNSSNNSTSVSLHNLTIETLRRAVDALSKGNVAEAQRALAERHPPSLEKLAPELAAAEAAVETAYALYSETLREREAILRQTREKHGPGPFQASDGRTVVIVARVRGEREQLFLRHSGASSLPPPKG